MVIFDNLHVGAQVEVQRTNGGLFPAKIMWKGSIVNRSGDWVGLELTLPGGVHDGMINNRRYFQCKRNHGLFVKPWQIRFSQKNLRSRSQDSYRSPIKLDIADRFINDKAQNESTAATTKYDGSSFIPAHALKEISRLVYDDHHHFQYENAKGYHLPHPVGGKLRPAKQDEPKSDDLSYRTSGNSYTARLKRSDPSFFYLQTQDEDGSFFRSPPSIPVNDPRTSRITTKAFYNETHR